MQGFAPADTGVQACISAVAAAQKVKSVWECLPPWSMGVAAKMGVISSSMLVRKQMNVVPAIARTSCNREQHFTVSTSTGILPRYCAACLSAQSMHVTTLILEQCSTCIRTGRASLSSKVAAWPGTPQNRTVARLHLKLTGGLLYHFTSASAPALMLLAPLTLCEGIPASTGRPSMMLSRWGCPLSGPAFCK